MLDKIIKNRVSLRWSLFAFLSITSSCYARVPPPTLHPILVKAEDCLNKNGSTVGMCSCLEEELMDLDSELNKVYTELMDSLKTPQLKASLKISQQAWLSFRDQEFAFLRAYYSQQEGTVWGIVAGRMLVDVVKDRVKELYKTLESLDMSGDSSKNYSFESQP